MSSTSSNSVNKNSTVDTIMSYVDTVRTDVENGLSKLKTTLSSQTAGSEETCRSIVNSAKRYAAENPFHTAMAAITVGSQLYKLAKRLMDRIVWHGTVLELCLERMVLAERPQDLSPWSKVFDSLGGSSIGQETVHYHEIVQALELAAKDSRIVGLIVTVGSGALLEGQSLSHLSEIREAIVRFRETKKFTIAHADSIGEFFPALKTYWIASACEHVMMSTTGMITIPPLITSSPFFKQMMQKLDMDVYVDQREAHKSAGNLFVEEKFTEEHKEQVVKIIEGIQGYIIADIAASRGVDKDTVEKWINSQTSLNPQQAVEKKAIDSTGTLEDAYDKVLEVIGRSRNRTSFLFVPSYLRKRGKPYESGKEGIAIVYAEGGISYGELQNTGIQGSVVARTLRQARNDRKVRVIIIRVNSPGGSAIGSEQITQEINLCRKEGKKVIVSMGVVAGSGGYWISCPADVIVCERMTITGSVGVVFTRFNVRELMAKKLGITFDSYTTSDNAKRFSSLFPLDSEHRAAIKEELDHLYNLFKEFVATSRNIDMDDMGKIAGGRIYLAEEAKSVRLVDHVGGLSSVIEMAKDMAGFSATDRVKLVRYPKRKGALAMLAALSKPADNREQRDRMLSGIGAHVASPFSNTSVLLARMVGASPVANMCFAAVAMAMDALQLPNARLYDGGAWRQPAFSLRSTVDPGTL